MCVCVNNTRREKAVAQSLIWSVWSMTCIWGQQGTCSEQYQQGHQTSVGQEGWETAMKSPWNHHEITMASPWNHHESPWHHHKKITMVSPVTESPGHGTLWDATHSERRGGDDHCYMARRGKFGAFLARWKCVQLLGKMGGSAEWVLKMTDSVTARRSKAAVAKLLLGLHGTRGIHRSSGSLMHVDGILQGPPDCGKKPEVKRKEACWYGLRHLTQTLRAAVHLRYSCRLLHHWISFWSGKSDEDCIIT